MKRLSLTNKHAANSFRNMSQVGKSLSRCDVVKIYAPGIKLRAVSIFYLPIRASRSRIFLLFQGISNHIKTISVNDGNQRMANANGMSFVHVTITESLRSQKFIGLKSLSCRVFLGMKKGYLLVIGHICL